MTDITKLSTDELTKAPLKELLALQERLTKAITLRKDSEKQEVYEKICALALEHGFELNDLLSKKTTKKGSLPAKYRNPDNKEQSWTGKGRMPNWLVSQLDTRLLQDFAV
jgi:DNA-binding protein H-NS